VGVGGEAVRACAGEDPAVLVPGVGERAAGEHPPVGVVGKRQRDDLRVIQAVCGHCREDRR